MAKSRPRADEQALMISQLVALDEPPELPYDQRWARRLLAGEQPPPPEVLRQELVDALVSLLVDQARADLLGQLAKQPQKALAKAARRGLHRLRSRGLEVELPALHGPPRSGTGQLRRATEIPGLVTIYDPSMQRAVWLAASEAGALAVYQAHISAEHGLTDFSAWESSRRNYNELQRKIRGEIGAATVPAAQARWFIHEAAARCQQAQRALPPAYTRSRQSLGAPPGGPHPGLALEPAQADAQQLAALLELPELALWLPERQSVHSLILRIEEVATSRLLIDEQQRNSQIQRVIDRELESHFIPERRAAYRRLLLDTAHLLAAAGKAAEARLARAGAELFELPPEQLASQPLARRFIERALQIPAPAEAPEPAPAGAIPDSSSGLILPGKP